VSQQKARWRRRVACTGNQPSLDAALLSSGLSVAMTTPQSNQDRL